MLFHYQVRQYYLYRAHTDMRKGMDSLSGLVRSELKRSPLTGDLFIFLNRRKTQIKMLHWQEDGFAIFYKRLESGTYELPGINDSTNHLELSPEQLLFILQGVVLKSIKKKPRYAQRAVDKTSAKSMVLTDV
jgi:transposase